MLGTSSPTLGARISGADSDPHFSRFYLRRLYPPVFPGGSLQYITDFNRLQFI